MRCLVLIVQPGIMALTCLLCQAMKGQDFGNDAICVFYVSVLATVFAAPLVTMPRLPA